MKIKDLKEEYPLVYKAALKNQVKQGNKENDTLRVASGRTTGNFSFEDTPQGFAFWRAVADCNFPKAEKICPELFKEEEWIPEIGDWCYVLDAGSSSLEADEVYQLTDINLLNENQKHCFNNNSSGWLYKHEFRKALEHENPTITPVKSTTTKFKKGDWVWTKTNVSDSVELVYVTSIVHYNGLKNYFECINMNGNQVSSYSPYSDKAYLANEREVLEAFEKIYPKGTEFKSAYSGTERVVLDNFKWSEGDIATNGNYVFHKGKFAEKVSPKEDTSEVILKVGDLIEALVDKPNAGEVLKGEIGRVVYFSSRSAVVNFPSQGDYYVPKVLDTTKYKLVNEPKSDDTPRSKFKVGDKVRCIKGSSGDYKGAGWESGLVYTISGSIGPSSNTCYFGGKRGYGVYEEFLELVAEEVPDAKGSGEVMTSYIGKSNSLPDTASELEYLYTYSNPEFTEAELTYHIGDDLPFTEFKKLKGSASTNKARHLMGLSSKKEVDSDAWEKLGRIMEFTYDTVEFGDLEKPSSSDEFMEPIKVQPYKKKKSKIKLIFNN